MTTTTDIQNLVSNSGFVFTRGSGSGDPASVPFIEDVIDGDDWEPTELEFSDIMDQLTYLDPKATLDESDVAGVYVRAISDMCSEYLVAFKF